MINSTEIFDDIHESLAVQQYGRELAEKSRLEGKIEGKIESANVMLKAGIPLEQVAVILIPK